MALFEKLAQFGKKIKGVFAPQPEITLQGLDAIGPKTMKYSGKVLGKGEKVVARVEQFTQPAEVIGANRSVLGKTSINTRRYTPAEDTPLAKMGVNWVETSRTSFGNSVRAEVLAPHGKTKRLCSHNELRNYVHLMK